MLASFLFPSEACVRRTAILSVLENPKCPHEAVAESESAVNEVWESCFNDVRPFYEPSISAAWICGRELVKSVPDLGAFMGGRLSLHGKKDKVQALKSTFHPVVVVVAEALILVPHLF